MTGKIFVVGTGPGAQEHITPAVLEALKESEVIIGYKTYINLIRHLIAGKEIIEKEMLQEVKRCTIAIEKAREGKIVAIISSGDPGVYAMSGLLLELLSQGGYKDLLVEILPGVPALCSCAAKLGAPLMHDFAAISLSDRLTPLDKIEKRLEAATEADFVIVLYNPKSKGRVAHIQKAVDIILRMRSSETPTGIVRSVGRDEEHIVITTLKETPKQEIDMQTTIIIGNSATFTWNEWMITPRGYPVKR